MDKHLKKTSLLNYDAPTITAMIDARNWQNLSEKNKILLSYNFVRDDIAFGYNADDAIPASQVLRDGYGQCNTKGILFMALLRALGIPCRMHGFTIDKLLQKGAMTGITYFFAPKDIVHSWVEVFYKNRWYNFEGFILDMEYLNNLQVKFAHYTGNFCGYGVATPDLKKPPVYWDENNTYIQRDGIVKDFGVFESPDDLFALHSQRLSAFKRLVYRNISRHAMNRNIKKIRQGDC
jgi:Transglutaminase-like enzymes, putative cysteine proteases